MLIDMRETDSGTLAEMLLIGAILPYSAPMAEFTPYTLTTLNPQQYDSITLLAQEAATIYNQDPARVQKAAILARTKSAVQNARYDFLGNPIKPTLKNMIVKGAAGWYNVSPKSCTCPDHAKGNTCKHRIAAWMHKESIIRPLAQVTRKTTAQVFAELTEDQTAQDF